MSLPSRPGYQKQTKSSSSCFSSSSSPSGGGALGARWNGNYSAGVSPVRGLSPVRSPFHGVGRQDMEIARSHTNPLFNSRISDIGRGAVHTTPTKACRECKENREKLQEPWKAPADKAHYSGKTLINPSTPTGKSPRTTATMRFTTPPKPVVKRKILAENREFSTTTCTPTRMKEEGVKLHSVVVATSAAPRRKEVLAGPGAPVATALNQRSNDGSESSVESDGLSASSPDRSTTTTTGGDPGKPKSPLVSIEELQKRIQKFLQDEGGTSAGARATDFSGPVMMCSPRQSTESLRRSVCGTLSADGCHEESGSYVTGFVDDAPFQPVVAPYSPRPESLRARKSPSPMEGNVVSPLRGEAESLIQEKTTAATPNNAYDPKNNFLSPRPQFLRYRPLRRLELLRKSAEGRLGDLDLESPATDADSDVDSSRVGSEKDVDEKEIDQSECQNVSQHYAQSLTSSSSSLEISSPRCKMSSKELFKSTSIAEGLLKSTSIAEQGNGEVNQLSYEEEPEQLHSSITSITAAPEADAASGLDVPSTDSKFIDYKGEAGELLEEEDAEDSNDDSSNAWGFNACIIVTVFAFVALLVVASGSPALLPTSLHESHISHLWKTSKVTEPIRQFLQTTEGLWADNPHFGENFSLSCPEVVRVAWVNICSFLHSHVDLLKVVENSKVVCSFCLDYSAKFGRFMKDSYVKLKTSLQGENNIHGVRDGQEEVNEWDWVPDYEFVVPHDMFDPVEAYENIRARVESWEGLPFWTSLVKFYAGHPSSRQIVDEPFDSPTEGRNASLCSLTSARPDDEYVLLPGARGSVVSDIPTSKPCQKLEPTVSNPEQMEKDNTPRALDAVQRVGTADQEIDVTGVVVTKVIYTPEVGHDVVENSSDAILEVQPSSSAVEERTSLSRDVEGLLEFHDVPREFDPAVPVKEDESQLLDTVLRQEDQSVPLQESVAVPSSPEGNEVDSSTTLETNPMAPRSLFLDELMMQAPGFRTTAAIFASLVLAAGVALLVSHKMSTRSGNSRTAVKVKASAAAQTLSKSSTETQRVETDFYPIEWSPGSEYFAGDQSSPLPLSLNPVTGGTPDQLLAKGTVKDSLQKSKSVKQLVDVGDAFQTPRAHKPEDSHLGLFTTMVPVVHNEGTPRERVQLTPVRRSSRIRVRMQNSPCHILHSP